MMRSSGDVARRQVRAPGLPASGHRHHADADRPWPCAWRLASSGRTGHFCGVVQVQFIPSPDNLLSKTCPVENTLP